MIPKASKNLRKSARGQSLVEFAFVSIFLFLLLMGIIEMGRLLFAFSVVSNAAQEGSRYAITRPRDLISQSGAATRVALGTAIPTQVIVPDGSCNIYDNARQEVWGIPRTDVSLDVYYENASGTAVAVKDINNNPASSNYYKNVIIMGNRVVVEASYKFDFIVPLISQFAPGGIDIKMSSARSILNNGESSFTCTVNYEPAAVPPAPTNTSPPTNTPTITNTPTKTPTVPTATKTSTPLFTSTSTRTATNTPTLTPTFTNTPTPTETPVNKLLFASADVYKLDGNNKDMDVVVWLIDQNGNYVNNASFVYVSAKSAVGQTDTTFLQNMGNGSYRTCNWSKFSGVAGDVTVTLLARKTDHQDAIATVKNKAGSYCSVTPTTTSTPTKTSTPTGTSTPTKTVAPTFTPSNTPTTNASVTATGTGTPTNTETPTPPPTLTPFPTSTPTPVACPYSVSISAYKASGNQRVYVSVQVTDALSKKVANAPVSAVIRGEVRRGTTDNAGNVCLVFNRYLGNSVSGSVSVSGPECWAYSVPFTSTTSGSACQ